MTTKKAKKKPARKPAGDLARIELPATTKATLRSRIVGEAEVDPATLKAHPGNWRVHSAEQRDAMRDVLNSVGWVQRIVINKTTGHILDGHMRVDEAFRMGEPRVPVLYVELSEDEERRMLAVLDPLSGMATVDKRRLRAVVDGMSADSDGLTALVEDLKRKAGLESAGDAGDDAEVQFTEELMEEHNYVVLYFDNPVDWLYLQSLYDMPKVKSLRSEGRFQQVGQARVFRGVEFLKGVRGEKA
jgi:ParB-like chromosome segregation protein Spo0J